jgi:hypothetical protein
MALDVHVNEEGAQKQVCAVPGSKMALQLLCLMGMSFG